MTTRFSYAADLLTADAQGYDRGVADVLALVNELALHCRANPSVTTTAALDLLASVLPNVLRGKTSPEVA
jgi:hypothetical protein